MTRRSFFARLLAAVLGVCLALAPWQATLRDEHPRWVPQSWMLAMPCGAGYVEARVYFNEEDQCWEWRALRGGGGRPAGYQWREGRCKMAREAKATAERAVKELSR